MLGPPWESTSCQPDARGQKTPRLDPGDNTSGASQTESVVPEEETVVTTWSPAPSTDRPSGRFTSHGPGVVISHVSRRVPPGASADSTRDQYAEYAPCSPVRIQRDDARTRLIPKR